MDVGKPLNSFPQEVQSPTLHKEGLLYSTLGIYPKDHPPNQSIEVCHIKNEINSGYSLDESIRNAAGDLLIDSGTSRESETDWCMPKSEPFNDLLCGGAALQVQLKEKIGVRLNFFCSYCSKGFAKKQQLQNHIKTHTQEKNFICIVCNKTFVHKQQLSNHEKTHTGKKDFECAFCNKRFILKQQMQIHMKTHTGEKNFECSMCGKRFITKQQLQNHVNSHLGVKPFTCSVCGKNFAHKQQLTRHETRHNRQTHFCVECNLKFKGNKLLVAHIKEVHNRTYNNL